MKNNLKMILVIIAAVLTANIVNAQQGRQQGPPQAPTDEQIEEMVANLAKKLSLSDEQEERVSDLYFEHFDEVSELQKQNKGSRGGGREAMQELDSELEENVNGLLTEEQKELYASYLEEQKSKRGKRGGPGDRK